MSKLITSLVVLAIPATALAHHGHEHASSPWMHHLLEYAGIAAGVALAFFGTRYLRANLAERKRS